MAWAALAVVFIAMERRFEWAAPSALWWGALVFAWSGWRMAALSAPAFRINLRHLDLTPPRRDQWIPLAPDGLRTLALGLVVLVMARPQSSRASRT